MSRKSKPAPQAGSGAKTASQIPNWPGWQDGYGAFTAANADRDAIIEYIKGQEEHHRILSFPDEYKGLLERAGVDYDPKYLA